jgi:hypothetical protein
LLGGWRVESLQTTNRSFIGEWPDILQASHNNPNFNSMWFQNGVRAYGFGYPQNAASANAARLGMLFAIDKSDFLSGADQVKVTFHANSRLLCGPFNAIGRGIEKIHFALRDSDQWYLSEFAFSSNSVISGVSTTKIGYGNATAVQNFHSPSSYHACLLTCPCPDSSYHAQPNNDFERSYFR